MGKTEVLITDRDMLRPGDVLRVWMQGIPEQWAEGPICERDSGGLMVCGLFIRWGDGTWVSTRFDLATYPARRTVPDLPTERGSVVRVTSLDGAQLPAPRVGVRVESGDTPEAWWISDYGYHRAGRITSWIPLAVTEAGPEVTR